MATSGRLTDGAKSRMIVPDWSELLKRSASVKQSAVKPEVFIGCSVESLDFAYAIQQNLQHTANVTVWDQGVFGLSQYALDNLIKQLGKSDFGIFVFAPQDVTRIRNKNFRTVRDNVILELGLFIGRLGRDRCFVIVPSGYEDLHLPTDLLGLIPGNFDSSRENLAAALGPVCNDIRGALKGLGLFRTERFEGSQVVTNVGPSERNLLDIRQRVSRPPSVRSRLPVKKLPKQPIEQTRRREQKGNRQSKG
jgi:predicted nucleotide-binding protein